MNTQHPFIRRNSSSAPGHYATEPAHTKMMGWFAGLGKGGHVPDLEAGSMLVKQLLFLADAQACGILPLEVLAAIRFEASPYLLSILHFSLLYFHLQKFKESRP